MEPVQFKVGATLRSFGLAAQERRLRLPALKKGLQKHDRTLDVSQWTPVDRSAGLNLKVLDQGQDPHCPGYAAAKALEVSLRSQGHEVEELSPSFGCLAGHNRKSYCTLGEIATFVSTFGICREKFCPQTATSVTKAAYEDAANYIPHEVFQARNFAEIGSDVIRYGAVILGLGVGLNCDQLDENGFLKIPPIATAGHCFAVVAVERMGTGFMLKALNSWGPSWGNNGYCYLSPGYIEQYIIEAYTVCCHEEHHPTTEPKGLAEKVKETHRFIPAVDIKPPEATSPVVTPVAEKLPEKVEEDVITHKDTGEVTSDVFSDDVVDLTTDTPEVAPPVVTKTEPRQRKKRGN